ncbi:CGNR zinc finger domain-containing protein [Brachybacterium tyrofermentans]|uniref:CGNR zinc finger domain-containing protein n=1 Tax=Brachybacterium tyrofermentans TaxID=47848 RepID=UPI003FD5890B
MDVATVYAGSMSNGVPEFRLGSVLSTSFTATLTERAGHPVERIPTPARLIDWLGVYGLVIQRCSAIQLAAARALREAIHLIATASARGADLPPSSVSLINAFSAAGRGSAALTREGQKVWKLPESTALEDALGVIAADAIEIVSGQREGRLALCASPTCRAAFFDTSRSRSRRWCDMNTCGNRQKKARLQAARRR